MDTEKTLTTLAENAIKRLKRLPQPVVRVSGPLTSGGYGYEENLRRFITAQQKLRAMGMTVYDYFEDNDDEQVIKNLEIKGDEVIRLYHQPILETGLIGTVYMLPNWEDSEGAKAEYDHFVSNDLNVHFIPEEWFVG